MKTVFMGTTQVKAEKTASEVMEVLRQSGARKIGLQFDSAGKINAMRFSFAGQEEKPIAFELPIRIEGLKKIMKNKPIDQVERTAWRQLLRWTQAQLAMIEVGCVQPAEVYAPYAIMRDGRLLGEAILDSAHLLLGSSQPSTTPGVCKCT